MNIIYLNDILLFLLYFYLSFVLILLNLFYIFHIFWFKILNFFLSIIIILFFASCSPDNNSLNTSHTFNINEEIISDPIFKRIPDLKYFDNNGFNLSNTWIVKRGIHYDDSHLLAILIKNSESEGGLDISISFQKFNYFYIREIVPNIYQFSGRKIHFVVEYEAYNPLRFDIYIQSRFTSDNSTRILVIYTPTFDFNLNNNIIEFYFEVPVFEDGKPLDNTNGLSVAFRLIGENSSSHILIKKISLKIIE